MLSKNLYDIFRPYLWNVSKKTYSYAYIVHIIMFFLSFIDSTLQVDFYLTLHFLLMDLSSCMCVPEFYVVFFVAIVQFRLNNNIGIVVATIIG